MGLCKYNDLEIGRVELQVKKYEGQSFWIEYLGIDIISLIEKKL
jgi:hypothetical protein